MINTAIDMIKNKKCDMNGNHKECFFIDIENENYVLLKHTTDRLRYSINDQLNMLMTQKRNTALLISKGISLVPFIDYKLCDGVIYELHKKADGDIFFKRDHITLKNKDEYVNQVLKTTTILATKQVSKFCSDIYKISKCGCIMDDYPENYIINEDGECTLVDIPLQNCDFTKCREIGEFSARAINAYKETYYFLPGLIDYATSNILAYIDKKGNNIDNNLLKKIAKNIDIMSNKWVETVTSDVMKNNVSDNSKKAVLAFGEESKTYWNNVNLRI